MKRQKLLYQYSEKPFGKIIPLAGLRKKLGKISILSHQKILLETEDTDEMLKQKLGLINKKYNQRIRTE